MLSLDVNIASLGTRIERYLLIIHSFYINLIKETEVNSELNEQNHKPNTIFSMKYASWIGIWNVCTYFETLKLDQLCTSFSDYSLVLLEISKVIWHDADEFFDPNELKLNFYSRFRGQKRGGVVGFFISREIKSALLVNYLPRTN